MFRSKKFYRTAFLLIIVLLLVIGVATLASLSFPNVPKDDSGYHYVSKQLIWITLGIGFFWFAALMNYKRYKEPLIVPSIYIVGIIGLLLVFFLGKDTKGANRWINIFGFKIQPSEFAKVIIIMVVSAVVDRLKIKNKINKNPWVSSFVILGITGVYCVLIILEKSYSSMTQVLVIGLALLFISGVKMSVFIINLISIILIGVLLLFSASYRIARILEHTSGKLGYQVENSLIAIGSGKFFGRGYGNGLQKYGFLPEIHTDYIFSGFAEENGFLGCVLLILVYIFLLSIILIATIKINDMFAKYLLFGIFMMFATQVLGNIAVVSNVMPSTGIPLPLMSYGGSGLIAHMYALGIVFNILKALYKQEMGNDIDENEFEYRI